MPLDNRVNPSCVQLLGLEFSNVNNNSAWTKERRESEVRIIDEEYKA
jgi:hypothetical protein